MDSRCSLPSSDLIGGGNDNKKRVGPSVTPAKAGVQSFRPLPRFRLRGGDADGRETARGNFEKGSGDIAEEKFGFRTECQK